MKTPLLKIRSLKFVGAFIASALLFSCGDQKKKDSKTTGEATQDTISESASFGGLALYTLRDAMAEDAKGTLKTVATDGYLNIEAAGYDNGLFYKMTPADFKSFAEGINLHPVSTHQGSVTLERVAKGNRAAC